MGLVDPTSKMSKSDDTPGQAIGIYDDPDTIRRSVMRATTDSQREIRFDPTRPGISNLLTHLPGALRRGAGRRSRPASRARATATSRRPWPTW